MLKASTLGRRHLDSPIKAEVSTPSVYASVM